MKVIFDLDGTLALTEHRSHFLTQTPKDWRSFYDACDKDEPNDPVIQLFHALEDAGDSLEIWTGRSKEVSEKTLAWLMKQGISEWRTVIRMREEGDHRPDTVLKQEWLDQCGFKPDLVFEDRASVVAMWRSNGIVCCQVAPGDF